MKIRFVAIFLTMVCALTAEGAGKLSLDSIAQWGKFPRFVVNTYRWGCDFFNGYDTTHVQGTGYPFNVKIKTESWTDYYNIKFANASQMSLISDPSTSLGFYLTYLALSGGYDVNVSKYFGGSDLVRKRWNFQFNCMLFQANLYFISNDVGTSIKSFVPPPGMGDKIHTDFDFRGIDNTQWGLDVVYYFRHKRYSAAAAFSYGRVQIRNGGSFFAGISYNRQRYGFNFVDCPPEIRDKLPNPNGDYTYQVNNHNYMLQCGYGYNWVFRPKFTLGISESPMIGWSKGYIESEKNMSTRFMAMSKTQLSIIYNNKRWFAGLVGTILAELNRDRERSLISSYLTFEASVGYRFKLW